MTNNAAPATYNSMSRKKYVLYEFVHILDSDGSLFVVVVLKNGGG